MAFSEACRAGLRFWTRYGPRFLWLGNSLHVTRWADAADVLRRDCDFLIAPVNREPIHDVAGDFLLGMDRSPQLFEQRQALYTALHAIDMEGVKRALRCRSDEILAQAAPGTQLDIVDDYVRPVAACMAARMIGVAGPDERRLAEVARHIFHAAFLNPANDPVVQARGRTAGETLRGWIVAEQARRTDEAPKADLLGQLMLQLPPPPPPAVCGRPRSAWSPPTPAAKALKRDIPALIAGNIVGLIDQIVMAVTYILDEILSNAALRAQVMADLETPRLTGWCLEAWRLHPNTPALLRVAAEGAIVGGKSVKRGAAVVVWTMAAMQDGRVFTEPRELKPDRDPALYLHFGYGIHACAGRHIATGIIPILVGAILRHNPRSHRRLVKDGSFPRQLIITF